MSRNQLLPNYVKHVSGGVMFTVENNGDISPSTQQMMNAGDAIVLYKAPSLIASVTHVCARDPVTDMCRCSTLVANVLSGDHMALVGEHTNYVINTSGAAGDYELYAMVGNVPVDNATNGQIHVGG